jgi:hypothetical protein
LRFTTTLFSAAWWEIWVGAEKRAAIFPTAFTRKTVDLRLVFLLLGAAAYLYVNLFFRLHVPLLLGGDQVYFWSYAVRLMGGERIYQDFFQFTAPGTDLVYFGLFKVLGPSVWVTNATVLVLGVALCWLSFAIAAKMMQQQYAMLATVFFLVVVYGKLLNATHHWFSMLTIMGAIRVYKPEAGAPRTLITGALLGIASFFTLTHGAVALIAFMLTLVAVCWRRHSPLGHLLLHEFLLLLSYAVTLFLLSAPYLLTVGFKKLWYFEVTFVRQYAAHVSQGAYLGLPQPISWHSLPGLSQYLVVYGLLVVAYPVSLWRCWRAGQHISSSLERVFLLSMVGLLLLSEVAFNMNWLRVFAVSFSGVILLFWNAEQLVRRRRWLFVLLAVGLACVGLRQTTALYLHQPATMRLRGGEVATSPQSIEKLRWVTQHTTPGQFFLQADWPGVYFPLRLRNPVFLDSITPGGENRPEDIALSLQQLEQKQVQYILWRDRRDSVALREDPVRPLRAYLQRNYIPVHAFADGDMVWGRNEFSHRRE